MAGPVSGLGVSDNQRPVVVRMFFRLFGGLLFLWRQQGLFFRFPIGFLAFGHSVLLRVIVEKLRPLKSTLVLNGIGAENGSRQ
jgi:hypothetical protein